MTGGSLGHGPAIAVGVALSDRHNGTGRRTFCLVGDGEMNEGSVWEASRWPATCASPGLTLIVDSNGLQALGAPRRCSTSSRCLPKLEAFGWDASDVDGHDHDALRDALLAGGDRPPAIVAHTVKGKGVASWRTT